MFQYLRDNPPLGAMTSPSEVKATNPMRRIGLAVARMALGLLFILIWAQLDAGYLLEHAISSPME